MDEAGYEIAMLFVPQGGGRVLAECTMQVDKKDPLMGDDFKSVTDMSQYSNFFEVTTFDFSMNNEPEDAGAGNLSGGGKHAAGRPGGASAGGGGPRLISTGPAGGKAPGQESSDPYHRWRSAKEEEARVMRFQLSFDSFRFTRLVDGASPRFFQSCAQQVSFQSASLVKRYNLGGASIPQAFMRFDFENPMLKSVKWDDGEMVTESCEFVCDGLTFKYRQQASDGTLGPVSKPSIWIREDDAKRKKEKKGG